MSHDTVTVDGAQFDRDDLAYAIEMFEDGDTGGYPLRLADDGDVHDDAVHVLDMDAGEIRTDDDESSIFWLSTLKEAVEEERSAKLGLYFADDDDNSITLPLDADFEVAWNNDIKTSAADHTVFFDLDDEVNDYYASNRPNQPDEFEAGWNFSTVDMVEL